MCPKCLHTLRRMCDLEVPTKCTGYLCPHCGSRPSLATLNLLETGEATTTCGLTNSQLEAWVKSELTFRNRIADAEAERKRRIWLRYQRLLWRENIMFADVIYDAAKYHMLMDLYHKEINSPRQIRFERSPVKRIMKKLAHYLKPHPVDLE